ncbi:MULTISPECIES: 2OG-Fe dioxygenase family protein [Streptomyces]|uniref:2OG-Fe dioxygenase family protein n=1 Tax=Streptomyces doebereineriae TaxID=3075528 RepID=A0ABU2VB05_9ACTN|nr:2OG-Fe dioxygenase family protein [Streptomyces sp. DSM 41640]MDT0482735.1 2OG-Fe dioxygenase family protein [Streptomyces sp. DSM 41640]
MSEPTSAAHPDLTHPAKSAAVRNLSSWGGYLQPAAEQSELIGASPQDWDRFAEHWDDLTVDTYMRDGGTYRYRRYGHFRLDAAVTELTALPHRPYRQESDINPLNGGIERHFDPLTDEFLADPLTRSVVLALGEIFSAVEGNTDWDVKLHPFRIVTSSAETGRPAPQGRHRDGSAFVTSLLVNRTNVAGGESSLYSPAGKQLLTATLTEPGDQLLVDDRAVLHDVTPVRPVDAALPAYRDVLIVDFDRL